MPRSRTPRGRAAAPVAVDYPTCVPKQLPADVQIDAAATAIAVNHANSPPVEAMAMASIALAGAPADEVLTPGHLALMTSKYWGSGGVKLTVSFLEPCPADLRDRILSHMNSWAQYANVSFTWTQGVGQVRITRSGDGYWSYIGVDISHIGAGQPTMCLQAFTMNTPESEYKRVVRHETGHTLGFVHEQQLPEIVELLDPAKTIAWGRQALGWSEAMVRSQILTPIDPRTVRMTPHADVRGIMCYQIPTFCTKSGQPIPGGTDIDEADGAFAATLYPKAVQPPPPPPPPPPPVDGNRTTITLKFAPGTTPDFEVFVAKGAATTSAPIREVNGG